MGREFNSVGMEPVRAARLAPRCCCRPSSGDRATLRRIDAAITYVINIPILLSIERVFEPGWRSSITRVRQAWIVLAAIGLPAALLAEDPSRLTPANNILVIVGVAVLVAHLGRFGHPAGALSDAQYTPVEHRIADGDRVVLYTDGIIEATNRQGEFFDPERLREFVARHPGGPSGTFCGALLDHLSSWCERGPDTGGFEDDITLVVASITTANA